MTTNYFTLEADAIVESIENSANDEVRFISLKNMRLAVHPHVYPSEQFRTTNFVLDAITPLLKNKTVCDMGCGLGIVGQYAIANGAKYVVQADINPYAIRNAEHNKWINGLSEDVIQIYHSDCFTNIPRQVFDLIVFNMPFHSDQIEISNPLQYAFYDPMFKSINKFFEQLPDYAHEGTIVTIAFSSKGDTNRLEAIFDEHKLNWKLWKVINDTTSADNRIYLITF